MLTRLRREFQVVPDLQLQSPREWLRYDDPAGIEGRPRTLRGALRELDRLVVLRRHLHCVDGERPRRRLDIGNAAEAVLIDPGKGDELRRQSGLELSLGPCRARAGRRHVDVGLHGVLEPRA